MERLSVFILLFLSFFILGLHNPQVYASKQLSIEEVWKFSTNTQTHSIAVVYDIDSDGDYEVMFNSNMTYVVDGSNGSIIWARSVFADVSNPPVAYGDYLISVSLFGNITTFFSNGSLAFHGIIGRYIYSLPIIYDINNDGIPEVIAASNMGMVFVLSIRGALLWYKYLVPIVTNPVLVFANNDGYPDVVVFGYPNMAYCLSGVDGSILWQKEFGASVYLYPAAGDIDLDGHQELLIGTNDSTLFCLDVTNGAEEWSIALPYPYSVSIGNIDYDDYGEIIISSYYGIYAIDTNGTSIWFFNITSFREGALFSTPCTLGDVDGDYIPDVVFGFTNTTLKSKLVILDGEDGELLYRLDINGTILNPPTIGDVDGDGYNEIIYSEITQNGTTYHCLGNINSGYIYWEGGLGGAHGTRNAYFFDRDSDFLVDSYEDKIGTDKFNADTDGDGYSDYLELLIGTDPKSASRKSLISPSTLHLLLIWGIIGGGIIVSYLVRRKWS